MTIPVLPSPPAVIPQRGDGQNPDEWIEAADDWVAYEAQLASALNTWITEVLAITSGVDFNSTSTTSLTVGDGLQSLTVDTGKLYWPGSAVYIARTSDPEGVRMAGVVDSYDPGTGALDVIVSSHNGSGTYTDWSIGIAAGAPLSGGSMAGKLVIKSVTGGARLRLPQGDWPSSPENGDIARPAGHPPYIYTGGSWRQFCIGNIAQTFGNKTFTSVTLTDTPIAPTAAPGTNTTQIATTAFVKAAVDALAVGYTITDAAGFAINPRNGNNQIVTLAANRTPVASGWVDGDDITLLVNGAGFSITWSTFAVTWVGTQPTLSAFGPVAIRIVQIAGTRYGWQESRALSTELQYVGAPSAPATGNTNAFETVNPSLNLTSLTGGVDTQARAGDLVLVILGAGCDKDLNLSMSTSGYTELFDIRADDTSDANLAAYYKFMTSTPDTTAVGTVPKTPGLAGSYGMAVQVWRNVDQSSPIDATTTTATGIDSVLANPPSNTPATGGSVFIPCGFGAHTAGAATFTASGVSAFQTAGNNNTGVDCSIGVGYVANLLGAYDPAAFGFSTSDNTAYSWAAASIILRRAT